MASNKLPGLYWDKKQEKVRSTNASKASDEFATALQRARKQKPKRNTTEQ